MTNTTDTRPTSADLAALVGQTVTIRYGKSFHGLGQTQHEVTGTYAAVENDFGYSVTIDGTWIPLSAIYGISVA